jgi:hypothetical protein
VRSSQTCARLRRKTIVHRMGRHGLPKFLELREGFAPLVTGSNGAASTDRFVDITLQEQRDYPAGSLRPQGSRASTHTREAILRCVPQLPPNRTVWSFPITAVAVPRRRSHPADGAGSRCDNGQRASLWSLVVTVAEPHSPSKPFLVSKWAGVQALTGQHGQPASGSSVATCSSSERMGAKVQ